jgi:trehalose 6-phosphate phosphatase
MVAMVAGTLQKARTIQGIEVVNIVPSDAPHKGMALERERARLCCDTAIYVGDDETDEDVFALDQPGRLLGIRVGRKKNSRADFYLEAQEKIDDLLRLLVRLREGTGALVRRLEGLETR